MSNSERYLCIHGHFYQPPRENPWLETVETQDSAAPYHDWNDRITAECYAPNGAARIVNRQNEIIRILNNYARISYNFGPTLLSWMEVYARRAYRRILEADRVSQKRFSGHGSTVAQAYNHIIMPLASTRDRITQIRWGIADFRHRFGRLPEGMWLPETAADSESLELLAEHGILFVILAPSQCARVRPLPKQSAKSSAKKEAETAWTETPDGSVDTRHPYLVRLKNGRSIAAFFYDGGRSRAIAFEGLLNSGENFAQRLMGGFSADSDEAQLVHVATDGESYGHHHHYGEMALAWMLHWVEENSDAKLTNYGEFLAKFPPKLEAQIVENTSWSCFHGVERWRSDCGCNGGRAGWNQKWRKPLRESLDWLRDTLAPLVKEAGDSLFRDTDAARNAYISVILDRSPASINDFFAASCLHTLSGEERTVALRLMELERHAMLMYTSCGWFFDDISGIETVQVIAYAGRVLQLAADLFGKKAAGLEEEFVSRLAAAKSNVPEQKDGAAVYNRYVRKMQVGLEQVAAHYAISSVFSNYPEEAEVFCYLVRRLAYEIVPSGRVRLMTGKAHLCSTITDESETLAFAVLHLGDQNISAVVRRYDDSQGAWYEEFAAAAKTAAMRGDFPEVVRNFDRFFEGHTYSIQSLFRDEQRRILDLLLQATLSEVESSLSSIYENQASLLHFLSQSGLPQPPALTVAASFAINAGLGRALRSQPIDAIQVHSWLELAKADQVSLDKPLLGFIASEKMKNSMVELHENPGIAPKLDNALLAAQTMTELPFDLNLWQAQNIWYDTMKATLAQAESEDWTAKFLELGKRLGICVDHLVVEEEALNGEGS
jgi:alpha-amylase/alpha-mannosidase (GH57 family)